MNKLLLRFFIVMSTVGFSAQLSYAQGINWTVAPYLWASDVNMDLIINNDPVLGGSIPFSDLVDNLDGAFMGHLEGSNESFGMFLDTIYIDLSDDKTLSIGTDPILGGALLETALKLKVYEIGGFYRMGESSSESAAFDLMLGARIVDVDSKLDITLPGPGAGQIQKTVGVTETDVFFGGRILGQFSDRWGYRARVDMGGGGTDGTLNLLASLGYTFGQSGLFSMEFGYKYLSIDLSSKDGGTYKDAEIVMSGPLIGFVFKF